MTAAASACAPVRHRTTYAQASWGDADIVAAIAAWIGETLPALLLPSGAPAGAVLDVGCGGQPFRAMVEASRRPYVGMDVQQNEAGTVSVVAPIDDLPQTWPLFDSTYPIVVCTEVLEHVLDIEAAFDGLRRLLAAGGAIVMTVPFVFPLHLEPFDFRRFTPYGLEALASAHGLRVERIDRLGGAAAVLATLLTYTSVLPAARSLGCRLKARLLRAAARSLVAVLRSRTLGRGVAVNSNYYLSHGVVLRAKA